jgi:nucleoside-diphosphate-sugar epimerase
MKILVTGASGYIGNKLVRELARQGNKVHAFDCSPSNALSHHLNVCFFKGDILNKEKLAEAMSGCEQVYHLAGITRLWAKDPDIFYHQHVGGVTNVLNTALELNVRKLVYTSSCAVWAPCNGYLYTENDPNISSFNNDYDLSKFLAEKLVREYSYKGLFTVIVNPPRVYGPGQYRFSNAVNRFICWLLNKKITPVPWHLETKANYAFIDDIVKGHIMAMEKGLGGERYILGGENISYRKFIDTVKKISGVKNIFIRTPSLFTKTYGWLELMRGKLNGHEPLLTPQMIERFTIDKMMDSSKAIKQLGYSITPFEEGMNITIDYLKKKNYVHLK